MHVRPAILNLECGAAAPLCRPRIPALWKFRRTLACVRTTARRAAPHTHVCSSLSAFTLVELILVMSMLVVVMALAAPTLAGFFRGRTLDSEARRLLSLTRYGQSRAVSEGLPMILWVDPSTGHYGLHAHESYLQIDSNSVEFQFATNLQVHVEPVAAQPGSSSLQFQSQLELQSQLEPSRDQLPEIYFAPDGTIGELSIPSIRLQRTEQDSLWIVQSLNRLHYEVRNNTNNWILPPQ